jgi:hypothetical protein
MNLAEFSAPEGRGRKRIVRRVLATINPDEHPTAVTSRGMAESCSQLDVRTITRVAGDIPPIRGVGRVFAQDGRHRPLGILSLDQWFPVD